MVNGLTQQLNDTMPLVVCGPGRNRDRVLADLKEAGHQRPMMSVGTTMGGRSAANEVLRNGLAGELLAQHRMVQEIRLLEEAWQRISTGGAVAYGRADIHRATEEGAVETLLIGADVLREESGVDGLPAWRAVAERVEVFSGKVVQAHLTTTRVSNWWVRRCGCTAPICDVRPMMNIRFRQLGEDVRTDLQGKRWLL